jgi:two-component system, NtrC family, response regulator GlrR
MSAPETHTLRIEHRAVSVPAIEIRVVSARGEIRRRLDLATMVLGSDPKADVSIADPVVSRAHCAVSLTEQGIRVQDLDSRNGTWFEGARIGEAWVPPGGVVRLSQGTTVSFEEIGGPTSVPLSADVTFGAAFGSSLAMRALFAVLERAAPTAETILLLGESGSGKELLARAVHDKSPRRAGPFVPLDCGAISPTLIESELFGHARGAFTGAVRERKGALAEADGGTLFLDEIGELPLDAQPKLLRALESRTFQPIGTTGYQPFDARVVAATHRDLPRARSEGLFRDDLYFRLAVIQARVPPLRERAGDTAFLVERFLRELTPPRTTDDLPAGALKMLREHDFPGNVRELKNTVIRLVMFPELLREAFDPRLPEAAPSPRFEEALELPLREARDQVVADFEKTYIRGKLAQHDGNVSQAATSMGVSRQFLHRKMSELAIQRKSSDDD